MNHLPRTCMGLLTFTTAVGVTIPAAAQLDISRPAPNVLLLVDTSGSMEYLSPSMVSLTSDPSEVTCIPTGTGSQKSRWIDLLEVLTGTIQDYRCETIDRHDAVMFRNPYLFHGITPYDYGYELPYHRPMSGQCRWLPGTVSSANTFDFPDNALVSTTSPTSNLGPSCDFLQSNDGILDSFRTFVRFGLMTFDTLTDAGTGFSGLAAQARSGMDGAWSYFLPGNGPAQGRPADCGDFTDYEVGARNAAAPPWEGRMVAFGSPTADQADRIRRNDQIQKILLATRPYLATPIAGLLEDAKQFLWNDDSEDPLDTDPSVVTPFGPRSDAYIDEGCRETHVILLTDGEPNLDLRPHCAAADSSCPNPAVGLTAEECEPPRSKCPYREPHEIAFELANTDQADEYRVKTHVIGFALDTVTDTSGRSVSCAALSDADLEDGGLCVPANESDPLSPELKACCTLNRIAYNGGTGRARFATNVAELRRQLMQVLLTLIEGTSRTRAVYAPSGPPDPNAAAYRVYSGFTPHPGGWHAQLERQRWICEAAEGEVGAHGDNIEVHEGDDFAANVNSSAGPSRKFYTVIGQPDATTNLIHSQYSIRPKLATNADDGAGNYGIADDQPTDDGLEAGAFAHEIDPRALEMSTATSECVAEGITSAATCSEFYLQWWVGLDNGNDSGQHRCPVAGSDCKRLGAIYHSTPAIVSRPSELLRDETYDKFASDPAVATRPMVLYTSTTDGFLHAFKVASNSTSETDSKVNSPENNELWAFAPPAVLSRVPGLFANPTTLLLDGAPVVRDVVARCNPAVDSCTEYRLERAPGAMRAATSWWRTVLVQGFGEGSGYFALDVTDPESGPQFLWQLSTNATGQRLFGDRTGTPLITTLYFDDGSGGGAKEVAVAVLPGGRATARGELTDRNTLEPNEWMTPSGYEPRSHIPSYSGSSDIRARSLTIVRLDSGEIIKTFRASTSEVPPSMVDTVIQSPLDSPVSGEPAAFPGATGAVADRIFVGDADGTLWRIDVASTNPDKWKMRPFFDLHRFDADHGQGQPIVSPPVLSTREGGTVTVLAASGDQDTFTPSGTSYIWSLDDAVTDDYWTTVDAEGGLPTGYNATSARVNWYTAFTGGERVAGPMALLSKVAYFATYTPAPLTAACNNGSSKVWGVDYVQPRDSSSPGAGGLGKILPPTEGDSAASAPQYIDGTSSDSPIGRDAAIFGVTIGMVPACSSTASGDPASNSGHMRVTSTSQSTFQLILQTGSSGSSPAGGAVNFTTLDVAQPAAAPTIDSWVAILE